MPGRTARRRAGTAAARLAGPGGARAGGMLLAVVALALVPGADGIAAVVSAHSTARSVTLLGSRSVGQSVAHQPAGRAEAFSYTATSSGKATALRLYVDSRGRNARLNVAVYSNFHHRPGVRLARGSRRHARAHAWDAISIRPIRLVAKRHYWLVVLPSRGRVGLRYRRTRACTAADRHRTKLRALPRRWGSRVAAPGCQISAYVSGPGTAGGSNPPAPGSPAPPSPPTSPAPPPALQTKNCFAKPSACGYPDQTNTGAPAGTAVTVKNGDQTINAAGTYSGWNVQNGSVRINASNVTIKDFIVTNVGDTANAILIPSGVTNVTIEDSTLSGASANNAIQYAVQNVSSGVVTGLRLNLVNCTECWGGSGTLQDSYANSNGVISGSHYEDIYYGGGGGPLTVTHDTLYDPQSQTAVIFTKGDFGAVGKVTITNNLLAGGGYTIYGGLSGNYDVTGPVTVSGNRFARCLTSAKYDGFGYTCNGGADSNGYYPHAGYYGPWADFKNSVTLWSGNYWDDNLATLSLS
jgi:hypothetical protein